MGCGCLNKELSTLERIRCLAVKMAKSENTVYSVYKNEDGSYGFSPIGFSGGKEIVEFITPDYDK